MIVLQIFFQIFEKFCISFFNSIEILRYKFVFKMFVIEF